MARHPQDPPRRKAPKLSRDDLLPLLECTCLNARLAARRLTAFFDARLVETGLTISQFGLMAQIAGAEDDTLGALADRVGLEASTLTRNLQGLARDGMVEIVVTEKDLRKRAVWLTEKGARALKAALPVWTAAQAEAAAVVNAPALRAIARGTRRLEA